MNFDVRMHLGTLGMTGALLVAAVAAIRPNVRAVREIGRHVPLAIQLDVIEIGNVRRFDSATPVDIGRAASGVSLKDPEVSRRHARFESRDGIAYVVDLDSRNGTFLNGRRVDEPIEIRAGDSIDIGTARLQVRSVQPWT
jgi:pSer/pThr/pTyr-binding forkhead associated (FHA) protein